MSLSSINELEADLTKAAKSRDQIKLSVLRLLKSSLKNYEIEVGHDASAQEIMTVLQKEAKKRQDSITQYGQAGRTDLVNEEQAELEILETYLPAKMSEADLDALIAKSIKDNDASTMSDMGKVIQAVMAASNGQADGATVSAKVKAALQ
ncbi:MAG: GatB/YqeY domain-containing protein [Candidatus Saccharibacteria bacterium]